RKRTGKRKATSVRPKDTRPKNGKTKPPETKTAMVGRLSNEEITSVVYARSNLNRLYSCIRSEIRRKTELPEVITLDFTINNGGRVSQVRMDNIKLDGSSLHRCFRQKLTSLRFRAYSGQVRNITIPFKIGS
ncbi:MAG: AgmX/PglI C-terminal domain-containing protein, partial [Deltaproteobacteria bacterium]|nr:AgmX/PglI C-terminal domain-containing protein [Deltaproteobacteria bacterium]